MKPSVLILNVFCMVCVAGCTKVPTAQEIDLKLGDTKTVMLQKMKEIGAHDVTAETTFSFTTRIAGEQKYFWWELKDQAIVAVLLAGDTKDDLEVVVIEIGEPGKGVDGIANWRGQKLKRFSSLPW